MAGNEYILALNVTQLGSLTTYQKADQSMTVVFKFFYVFDFTFESYFDKLYLKTLSTIINRNLLEWIRLYTSADRDASRQ